MNHRQESGRGLREVFIAQPPLEVEDEVKDERRGREGNNKGALSIFSLKL
jgi:hypothetical protein